MKKYQKGIDVIVVTLILAVVGILGWVVISIANEPSVGPGRSEITKEGYPITKLFEHDGCVTYKFYDAGSHYYVNCHCSSESISVKSKSCGKNCVAQYDENVSTSYKE